MEDYEDLRDEAWQDEDDRMEAENDDL